MALKINRFAAGIALAASFSMAAPASAANLPYAGSPAVAAGRHTGIESAGYGPYRHPYRRGPSTGDVLAGVLILGGIAAVATAASRSSRNRSVPPPPYPEHRSDYQRDYRQNSGIDRAVEMCVDEVERGGDRVESVERADRDAYGWHVSGRLDSGAGWTCQIDNDGRIRDVESDSSGGSYDSGLGSEPYAGNYRDNRRDIGGYAADYRDLGTDPEGYDDRPVWTGDGADARQSVPDRQYDDETYARVRASMGGGYATPEY